MIFQDFEGREIRVVTDLMQVTAEQIAQMYKARWQIEVFFRWIKQHLNFPLWFAVLIVYVLLKWLFDASNARIPLHTKLSFIQFSRLLVLNRLPSVWDCENSAMGSNTQLSCGYLSYIIWLINRSDNSFYKNSAVSHAYLCYVF
ncbi:transposase [Paenibacillus agricola]|uniref:transposase n=1 Tax=Paenibacillus agricola TaxID=2716264 RepID=UPI0035D50EB6